MSVKGELRKQLKKERRNIENKIRLDERICDNLLKSDLYKNAETVLFYAALEDEINIDRCIEDALSNGKKAALPVCTDCSGNMKFYYINSFDDVKAGRFGVREPDAGLCGEVTDFSHSICIVPAVVYDRRGYRLGYGKGYYDRFLKNYTFISVGMCYNEFVRDRLPIGEYDVPVNYIITQDSIFSVRAREEEYG